MTMAAWMTNSMMGFLGSYTVGSTWSKMPPWGVALTVAEVVAAVTVTVFVKSVTVAVAIMDDGPETAKCSPILDASVERKTSRDKCCN